MNLTEKFRRRLERIEAENLRPRCWLIHPATALMVESEAGWPFLQEARLKGEDHIWGVPVVYSPETPIGVIRVGFWTMSEAEAYLGR